jgi:hypothetical protein
MTPVARGALGFPEYNGTDTYLAAALIANMYRRVPVSEYPPCRIKALLVRANAPRGVPYQHPWVPLRYKNGVGEPVNEPEK